METISDDDSGGGGDDGHEEIASLPSNDVTTNANLITGPDIANWPGPVVVVVVVVVSIRRASSICAR